jgi:hypothetical protein
MLFRAKTFTPQEVNVSCFGCPCPSSLGSKGASGTRGLSPQGIFALQRQAQKFLGRLFSKRRDGSLRTVEAKTILHRFLKAAVKDR